MKNLENNKLIAEFEGHTINYGFNKEGVLFLGHHISANDLIYDSSWDWLMVVIHKIEVIQKEMDCETIIQTGAKIWAKSNNKLEGTYKAVVEFIKWYNKNK